MNKTKFALSATTLFVLILACSSLAQAQATRTWVSGVGDDANPCSRTAPCKTFAGAISKTAACGEISVLDPGGFGAVTITKSITINGDGTLAGILASLTNGIIVNGANAVVTLRSLSIDGACNGLNGIRFIQGSTLSVENTTIYGFTGFGIDINRGAASGGFASIKNVSINNCVGGGINVTQNNASPVRVAVAYTSIFGSNFGIKAGANSRVSARECDASGMSAGFLADGSTARMNLDSCMSTNNGNGVQSDNSAIIRIADCTLSDNITKGVSRGGGALGTVESYGINRIRGNPADDAVSGVLQQ
jgi:hypothetical protein